MRDEKIINRTIKFFEKVYPSENKYIVIQSSGVKYVQPQDNVVFISSASGLIDFLEEISSYKYLIIHFLSVSDLHRIICPNLYIIIGRKGKK